MIEPRARIHIGLLDVAGTTGRRYGGSGFGLQLAVGSVSLQHGPYEVRFHGDIEEETQRRLIDIADQFRPEYRGIIDVRCDLPQHVGLGTTTALSLGLLLLLSESTEASLSRDELVGRSGRGGASGIGVNVFFDGGFIADGGHPTTDVDETLPSRYRQPKQAPPVICHFSLPDAWRITLILPDGTRWHGGDELAFFRNHTEIAGTEINKAIALTYHGVATGMITADLQLVRNSLQELHHVGFKAQELRGQTNDVRDLLGRLWEAGCAAGMSSMGPLVYVVHEQVDDIEVARSIAERSDSHVLGTVRPRDIGPETVVSDLQR